MVNYGLKDIIIMVIYMAIGNIITLMVINHVKVIMKMEPELVYGNIMDMMAYYVKKYFIIKYFLYLCNYDRYKSI
jgi:hypothetical protein